MTRLHDRIKDVLDKTPGLTQRGLAIRMGLNPAAVNRMVYGRRAIKAEEIPVIEDYIGVKLDVSGPVQKNFEYRQSSPAYGRHGFSDVAMQPLEQDARVATLVPVYGRASGGMDKGPDLASGDVADWVPRHPAQAGIRDAFAVYVFSDLMEPRYYRGELLYIHPGRPVEQGKDCLIEMKNGEARIFRLVRQDGGHARVAQFNPPLETDIPGADIKAIYAVVGRG